MTFGEEIKLEDTHSFCAANSTNHVADWSAKSGSTILVFASGINLCVVNFEESPVILETYLGHSSLINCVKWIKSSSFCVSGSTDKTIRIWKLVNNKLQPFLVLNHSASVVFCCGIELFDGNLLILCSDFNSTVSVFKISHLSDEEPLQQIVAEFSFGSGFALCGDFIELFDDKTVLLALGLDTASINLYASSDPLKEFVPVQQISGHTDWITDLSFVKTDKSILLASCSQDSYVRINSISQFEPASEDTGLRLKHLEFSVLTRQYSVRLETVLSGHDGWVYSVNWLETKDGAVQLLTASIDKCLIVWYFDSELHLWLEKTRMGTTGGNSLGFYGACFSSVDGCSIFANSYHGGIHFWNNVNLPSGSGDDDSTNSSWISKVCPSGHFASVEDLDWEPKFGSFLISCSQDQTTRVWAPWKRAGRKVTYHEIARPQIHGHDLQCVAMVSSSVFVSGSEEKIPRVFTASRHFIETVKQLGNLSDEIIQKMFGDQSHAEGAAVPALGLSNKAVSVADQITEPSDTSKKTNYEPASIFQPVELHEPPTHDYLAQNTLWPEVFKLYGHGYEIFCVAANHAGTFVASACKASKPEHAAVIIWNCDAWQQVTHLLAHTLTVTQMVFSPDDRFLLTVSRDRTWSLFDTSNWTKVACSDKKTCVHSRIIWGCAWLPGSDRFITVARDGKAVVWFLNDELRSRVLDSPTTFVEFESMVNLGVPVTCIDCSIFIGPRSRDSLVAFGLETGQIVLYRWTSENKTLENAFSLNKSDCHASFVKKVKFRPILGKMGFEDDNRFIQLATCATDYCVKIFNFTI